MDNQNFSNQMNQENSNKQEANLLQGINMVRQQIATNDEMLYAKMHHVENKVDIMGRKKRRVRTSREMQALKDGTIAMIDTYDNGERVAQPFISNLKGKWGVFSLRFLERCSVSVVGIFFSISQEIIYVDEKNISSRAIYESFLRAGVKFSSEISAAAAKQILFETFVPEIEEAEKTITVSALAGWYHGKFLHKENFPYRLPKNLAFLPIYEKNFPEVNKGENVWKCYFNEMKQIQNWRDRVIIMTFPFAGIMASILKEERRPLNVFLNFIRLCDFPKNKIPMWMQIFNRHDMRVYNPLVTDKRLQEKLHTLKDEVLIVDFCIMPEEERYKKVKLKKRLLYIGDCLTGKSYFAGELVQPSAAFAAISDDLLFQDNVYNILVTDDFYRESPHNQYLAELSDSEIMESLFTQFVSYVTRNLENIWEIIRRKQKNSDARAELFSILWDLLSAFWESLGINLQEAAQVPLNIDFEKVFWENSFDMENLLEVFLRKFRYSLKNYSLAKRTYGCQCEADIFYTEENLLIPTLLLNKILKDSGLWGYKRKILVSLKHTGNLQTDSDGLTRKIQINGKRREMYQVSRSFFNSIGSLDITSLGKEPENVIR